MFGQSFLDMLRGRKAEEIQAPLAPVDFDQLTADDEPEHGGFTMALKKKRQGEMMKKMLEQAGYGELAKMVSIREDR